MDKKEIIEGIQKSGSDFMYNNYHLLTSEQKRIIATECYYLIPQDKLQELYNNLNEYLD